MTIRRVGGLILVSTVLAARPAAAQDTAAAHAAPRPVPVTGTVSDSVTGDRLAGAVVQLLPESNPASIGSVAADSAGQFRFPAVAPGRYIVGFMHPAVDALGIEPPLQALVVQPGVPVTVELSTPSPQHLFAALCGATASGATSSGATSSGATGALAGIVRDADTGAPIPGAKVVLTWNELGVGVRGIETVRRRIPATAGADGAYRLCGASSETELVASAEAPGRRTGLIEVRVPAGTLIRRDFALGDSSTARVVLADTGAAIVGAGERGKVVRGSARLSGVVRGRQQKPLGGATVLVWGTGVSARTREDGSFTLSGLPAGTYSVEARALGYAPGRVAVDLASHVARSTILTLSEPATTLSPVVVMGKRSAARERDLNGFLARSKNGFGHYLTAADIERRQPQYLTDVLRTTPGLQVTPNGAGFGYQVRARGNCTPTVYVDGMPMIGGASDLDTFLRPGDVSGVEVYTGAAGMPAQFTGGCAIAIWTKR